MEDTDAIVLACSTALVVCSLYEPWRC